MYVFDNKQNVTLVSIFYDLDPFVKTYRKLKDFSYRHVFTSCCIRQPFFRPA